MENMGPVAVNPDSVYLCAVDVSPDVIPLFHDQAAFTAFSGHPCKDGSVEAAACEEIIVLFHGR